MPSMCLLSFLWLVIHSALNRGSRSNSSLALSLYFPWAGGAKAGADLSRGGLLDPKALRHPQWSG